MKTFTKATIVILLLSSLALQGQVSEQFSFSANDVEITQSANYDVVNLNGALPLSGDEHVETTKT